jgi:hypothetical protein
MNVAAAIERELGPDLAAAVRSIDAPLLEATAIAGRGYPGYRPSAYRLRFADGRVLKGRRLRSAEQAARVQFVSDALREHRVAVVVTRVGCALLSEWIEGTPLAAASLTPRLLRQCGAWQARVHNRALPAHHPFGPRDASVASKLERRLAELIERDALSSDEAVAIRALAQRHRPADCAVGFMLGDVCADNLVLRAGGDACLVDEETLSIGACEYDLARTWYRWPMTAAERDLFLAGYAEERALEPFVAHFPYWAITVLIAATVFRVRRAGAGAAMPIARLRALRGALERGAGNDEALRAT